MPNLPHIAKDLIYTLAIREIAIVLVGWCEFGAAKLISFGERRDNVFNL